MGRARRAGRELGVRGPPVRDGSDTWRTLGNGNGAAGQNTAWSQKGHLGGGPRGRARAQPGLWEGESWAQPRRAQGRKRGAQFRQGFGVERGGRQPPTGHFHFCSWRASWRRWPCPPASPPQELAGHAAPLRLPALCLQLAQEVLALLLQEASRSLQLPLALRQLLLEPCGPRLG